MPPEIWLVLSPPLIVGGSWVFFCGRAFLSNHPIKIVLPKRKTKQTKWELLASKKREYAKQDQADWLERYATLCVRTDLVNDLTRKPVPGSIADPNAQNYMSSFIYYFDTARKMDTITRIELDRRMMQ